MRTIFSLALWAVAATAAGQLPVEVDWTGKPVKRLPDGSVAPKSLPIDTSGGKVRVKLPSQPVDDGFEGRVEKVIAGAGQSAADRNEAGDVRTLSWLLSDY